MDTFINRLRLEMARALAGRADPRLATVSSFDPQNYAAKVMVQPENVETGWLPVLSPWIGSEWGFFAPVTPGDQVLVLFQENDQEVGLVLSRLFSNQQRPLAVDSGELWLVHQSGSYLKLTNADPQHNVPAKVLINGMIEIDATATTINLSVSQQDQSNTPPTINITASASSLSPAINITANGGPVNVKGATVNLNPS